MFGVSVTHSVMPAKAGIHADSAARGKHAAWTPAFAGVTDLTRSNAAPRAGGETGATLPSAPALAGKAGAAFRPSLPAIFPALAAALLAGCAASQTAAATAPAAPGFLLGLWHGFIFPIAWIVSLFVEEVAVYAVPNNGGWYDFGYFLGIVVFGVGARKTVVRRERIVVEPPAPERPATGSHSIRREEGDA